MARTGGNQSPITGNHYPLRYNPIESRSSPGKKWGNASNLMKAKVELRMNPLTSSMKALVCSAILSLMVSTSLNVRAESCQTSDDMDAATKNAITAAGQ